MKHSVVNSCTSYVLCAANPSAWLSALCGMYSALNHSCPARHLLPDSQLGVKTLLKLVLASSPSVWCMAKCSLYVFCLAASGEGQM